MPRGCCVEFRHLMKTSRQVTAIVPVAGSGTRLRPHTHSYPKVLLAVGGKPILGHITDQLVGAGVNRIVFVVGQFGSKVRSYITNAYPKLDAVFVEQEQPLGLGHAVWTARAEARGSVLILLGDTILAADMKRFSVCDGNKVGVREVPDPRRFGVVELKKGFISKLVEKPQHPRSNLAIVGVYAFSDSRPLFASLEREVSRARLGGGEIQLTNALMDMVRSGAKIKAVPIDGWYDCGKPDALLATNRYLLENERGKPARKYAGSLIIPPVHIAPGVKINRSIIGPYVSVGAGADISNAVVRDSIINENAVLDNVIMEGSLVGPSAVFRDNRRRVNIGESSEIILEGGQS